MLDSLKEHVCAANLDLVRRGLVFATWGNASGIERDTGYVVIKPSGVHYDTMRPEDMVVTDLEGDILEGTLRPSVDLPAHLALYNAFPELGGIAHTHSHYATSWAQARKPIPCFGTTHADYFYGEVPLADALTEAEVAADYERHIGEAALRCLAGRNPLHFPGVLMAGHAPFAWGRTPAQAVESAAILEKIARMALDTLRINPGAQPIEHYLLDKHFLRKHGEKAYYGQQ